MAGPDQGPEYRGVEVTERRGSRVGLKKGNERIVVHRPHPGSVTGRATVRDIRRSGL